MNIRERAIVAGQILYNSISIHVSPNDEITLEISDGNYDNAGNTINYQIGNSVFEIPRDEYRKFITNILFALWTGVFGEVNTGKRLKIEYDNNLMKWKCHSVYS